MRNPVLGFRLGLFYTAPLAVQFPGPLEITPTCLGEAMAPIPTDVSTPGPTPAPDEALTSAITATSGLFGPCAPTVTDSATGTIVAPTDATMTMDVRCSAQVVTEAGFAVVTVEMSTPSDKPSPKIADGIVTPPALASDAGAAETLVWRFVVTGTDAVPVGSATQFRTKAVVGWTRSSRSRRRAGGPVAHRVVEAMGLSRAEMAVR